MRIWGKGRWDMAPAGRRVNGENTAFTGQNRGMSYKTVPCLTIQYKGNRVNVKGKWERKGEEDERRRRTFFY